MNRLFQILVATCLFAVAVFAEDVYFREPFTLWQDPEILVWTPDSAAPVTPKEFALSLKRNNSGIGSPSVRIAGELERDSSAVLYATWLKNNLLPGIPAELLKAREAKMQERLATIEDKYILYMTQKGNTLLLALFDETSYSPKVAGELPFNSDKVALGDAIAKMFFGGSTNRRLTKEERAKKAVEPNEYYSKLPTFRGFFGVAGGKQFLHHRWWNQSVGIPMNKQDGNFYTRHHLQRCGSRHFGAGLKTADHIYAGHDGKLRQAKNNP